MFYGVPIPGRYVASLPATIEAKGQLTRYSVLIDNESPINPGAPSMQGRPRIPATAVGGQGVVVQAVDLEPATTYHYRFLLRQTTETSDNEVLGPEGTFTTLPPPAAAYGGVEEAVQAAPRERQARPADAPLRAAQGEGPRPAGEDGGQGEAVRRRQQADGPKEGEQEGPGHLQTGALQTHPQSAPQEEGQAYYMVKVTASPPDERPSSITLTEKLPR